MNRRGGTGLAAVAAAVIILGALRMSGSGKEGGEVVTDVAVHVGEISRATLHRYVTAYGYVEPEPAGDGRPPAGAMLSPLVGGVLAEINGIEGRRVTKGTVVFRLDTRLAEVAVQRAQQEVGFAEQTFQRQQELIQSDGTSQRAFLEAQQRLNAARSDLAAAETALAYLHITAPLTGTLVALRATVGQFVNANTVLARVVDLNRLVVSANVPTREAEGLRVGQRVLLRPDDAAIHGTLTIIGKNVDPSTGTYVTRSSIPAGSGLMPGEFTDLRIVTEEHADVLVVPEVSLVTSPAASWIMVVEGDQAVRQLVTVGLRDEGLVEVSGDGLTEGMTVVTDDAYSLPEQTKIRIVGR